MTTLGEAADSLERELNEYRKTMRERFSRGVLGIHSGIVAQWYSARRGSSQGLSRRTGAAARSWQVTLRKSETEIEGSVFSAGVSYADFSEQKRIVPKDKKWLAIPVGAALTPAGAARYPGGPRQAAEALKGPRVKYRRNTEIHDSPYNPLSFFRRDSGTILVFAKKGVTGAGLTKTKRLLFVLKKSVTRPARTAGLLPWVEKQIETINERMMRI